MGSRETNRTWQLQVARGCLKTRTDLGCSFDSLRDAETSQRGKLNKRPSPHQSETPKWTIAFPRPHSGDFKERCLGAK